MSTSDNILKAALPASKNACAATVRWIFKQDLEVIMFFFNRVQQSYFNIKKSHKTLASSEVMLIAFLSTAFKVKKELQHSPSCISIGIKTPKIKRKMIWLQDHKALISGYRKKGLSYRDISKVIQYRFRIQISHTYIANYITAMEGCND